MAEANMTPRELTADEREDLVKMLFSAQVSGAEVLLRQVPSARVTGGIPLLLELTVDRSTAPAPVRNSPIAGRWAVKSSNGDLEGELLVWDTSTASNLPG
jgi:hypothetical protein